MPRNSHDDYLRVENQLDALPSELTDTMDRSIAKYIRKHGATEVNSTKAGSYILGWKESSAWNKSFDGKDASSAFGISLKRYMAGRPMEWCPAIEIETERGTTEKVYNRK